MVKEKRMWGNDDFQKDVEKVRYRKRVREAAERQEGVERFIWLLGFLVFATLFGYMLTPDQAAKGVNRATQESAQKVSAKQSEGGAVAVEVTNAAKSGAPVTGASTEPDATSIPASTNPALCLNVISRALARAGSRWEQEVSPDVAAQCRREIVMQRQRDRVQ
jgi:cell division protein FtsL